MARVTESGVCRVVVEHPFGLRAKHIANLLNCRSIKERPALSEIRKVQWVCKKLVDEGKLKNEQTSRGKRYRIPDESSER